MFAERMRSRGVDFSNTCVCQEHTPCLDVDRYANHGRYCRDSGRTSQWHRPTLCYLRWDYLRSGTISSQHRGQSRASTAAGAHRRAGSTCDWRGGTTAEWVTRETDNAPQQEVSVLTCSFPPAQKSTVLVINGGTGFRNPGLWIAAVRTVTTLLDNHRNPSSFPRTAASGPNLQGRH